MEVRVIETAASACHQVCRNLTNDCSPRIMGQLFVLPCKHTHVYHFVLFFFVTIVSVWGQTTKSTKKTTALYIRQLQSLSFLLSHPKIFTSLLGLYFLFGFCLFISFVLLWFVMKAKCAHRKREVRLMQHLWKIHTPHSLYVQGL